MLNEKKPSQFFVCLGAYLERGNYTLAWTISIFLRRHRTINYWQSAKLWKNPPNLDAR